MKVLVKKNLIIFCDVDDWKQIYANILLDYGMGMTISYRMRRELGFTYRVHQEWVEFDRTDGRPRYYAKQQVHVDFYSEQAQTWFQLKYLNL